MSVICYVWYFSISCKKKQKTFWLQGVPQYLKGPITFPVVHDFLNVRIKIIKNAFTHNFYPIKYFRAYLPYLLGIFVLERFDKIT